MKRNPYLPVSSTTSTTSTTSPTFWRSVEHKAQLPAVVADIEAELQNPVPTASDVAAMSALQRRDVLKLAGASLALGGLSACVRRPEEEILPYVKPPEEIIPGIPNYYATAMPRSEGAIGLVVEAHEGRPTKIEGNALSSSSMGAADVWAQSEIIKLYDCDRARSPKNGANNASLADWETFSKTHFAKFAGNGGQGLALLLEDDEQPTRDRLIEEGLSKLPNAKVYRYDALAADNTALGAELAFGVGARAHFDLTKAKVVLALDSNFLVEGPDHIRLAKQWGKARRPYDLAEAKGMSRLYAVEGVFSTTGANADNRLRLPSSQVPAFAQALAAALVGNGVSLGEIAGAAGDALPADAKAMLAALAKDLAANKGAAVVLVGERQPAAVHALAHAINTGLGAQESGALTVTVDAKAKPKAAGAAQLEALKKDLEGNAVDTLVVIGDMNPVYTAPGALKLADAFKKAKVLVHASVVPDETALLATSSNGWHVPLCHFLEAWGDARAWDGTASVVQPLILPLFESVSPIALVAQVLGVGQNDKGAFAGERALVEATWVPGIATNDKAWRKALHDGVIAGSARAVTPSAPVKGAEVQAALAALPAAKVPSKDALELVVLKGNLLDGRLANNTWNQELPDTMTKLCWDNAVVMSPALAKELGVTSHVSKNGYDATVVTLSAGGATVEAPAFVLPGYAPNVIGLTWGMGRGKGAGEVARGSGFKPGTLTTLTPDQDGTGVDPAPLRATGSLVVGDVKVAVTGKVQQLCSTQDHFNIPASTIKDVRADLSLVEIESKGEGEQRQIGNKKRTHYRSATLKMYEEKPGFAMMGNIPEELVEPRAKDNAFPSKPLQPTQEFTYDKQQWGMTIDLSACIGCGACTVACQAENNIAVVGRHDVLLGRELHWIRIDRYFVGDIDMPEAAHQPVNCMHCENAPCEPVCPVSATTHDEEGINAMAYNRCIGTRYCANNCPYKVRRYNYLDFTHTGNIYTNAHMKARYDIYKLQRNPNVSVRYRGVMEKCTYCTQRIEEAKIALKRAGGDRKKVPDGAIVPACQQTCPTDAIVFGNINDKDSQVAHWKLSERNYEMLQELNVRPRTTYLARVKNPNPEIG